MLAHESVSRLDRKISSSSAIAAAVAAAISESAPGGTPDDAIQIGDISFTPTALGTAPSEVPVLWTVPEVMGVVRVKSRTSLYLLEKNAGFPKRIHIGTNVAFLASEVIAWIQSRAQARDTELAPAVIDTSDTTPTSDQPVAKRGRGRPRKTVITSKEG